MEQTNRSFQVEYDDTSLRDGTYDVTFTLSEDAEDALFAAFDREISDHLRNGVMPDQKVHLLRRLCEQQSEHPPWVEANDGERTYDLELSSWDYHLLTKVIGESLSNVLRPSGAERYEELVDIWLDVTEQMQIEKEIDDIIDEAAADLYGDDDELDICEARFECFTANRNFSVYDDDGTKWYNCINCHAKFKEPTGLDECPEC